MILKKISLLKLIVDLSTKLIGVEGARLPPRLKASAWNGNQLARLTEPKKIQK
jgi:hypothetical protein